MLASARDWAKFGLLYLNDGVVGGKTHPARGLGGFLRRGDARHRLRRGLLTNRSDHPNAKGRVRLGIPRDSFFASGDLGQRIVICRHSASSWCGSAIPSIRPAISEASRRLVKEVIAAMHAVEEPSPSDHSTGPPFSSARA